MVKDKNDLAFVVGVNISVLCVQDFTADQALTGRAISQLAPGGGTSLWDAVAFGAEKMANRVESQPVARVLVVISDGDNNSSNITLKQAIAKAQQGEVAVYTVSTGDGLNLGSSELIGDQCLENPFRAYRWRGLPARFGSQPECRTGGSSAGHPWPLPTSLFLSTRTGDTALSKSRPKGMATS